MLNIKYAMGLYEVTWSLLSGDEHDGPAEFKKEMLHHDISATITVGEFHPT